MILIALSVALALWFCIKFPKTVSIFLTVPIGIACWMWADVIADAPYNVEYFFYGLAVVMGLISLSSIIEFIDDVATPTTIPVRVESMPRAETKAKRHWGMHKQNRQ